MGAIVGGIILFVIGAIISFALEVDIPGMESSTLGTILMVAGVVLFLIGLLLALRGRRTVVSSHTDAGTRVDARRDDPRV